MDKQTQAWDKEESKKINMLLYNVYHVLVKSVLFPLNHALFPHTILSLFCFFPFSSPKD